MLAPRLLHGDARSLPLSDGSIDLIVTSPPYFALRSYRDGGKHCDGQIGAEATPADFIAALIECTREMMRVLKPSGSIFVNLGDKYRTNKSLGLLPERYRIAAVDQLGLIARAVIVWNKPNGLPEPATDRVRRSHEDWVHLVKSPRYFSAVDELREPTQQRIGAMSWADRKARGDAPRYGEQRIATPGDGGLGTHPLGKLPGSVWEIASQPLRIPPELKVGHSAAFPMEWPRRLILGWSPPGGVVLDPFSGTGTTVLVATVHGRQGIGVDLSHDYLRSAEWRINDPKQRERASRPAKQLSGSGASRSRCRCSRDR